MTMKPEIFDGHRAKLLVKRPQYWMAVNAARAVELHV